MAGGVVYLDLPQVEQCVNDVNNLKEELLNIANKMDAIITKQLPEYWKGASSDKTQQVYAEDYQPMLKEKLPDAVASLSKFINDCKIAIKETDEKLSGQGQ